MTETIEASVDEQPERMPLGQQLFRFVATGGLSAIVDFGSWTLLTMLGLNTSIAKAIGFVLGTTTAYLINRRWTFKATHSARRFIAVFVLYLVTFFLNTGLTLLVFWLLQEHGPANLPQLGAQVIAFVIGQGAATTVNFIVQRFLIFRFR
ncbi:GtrA family protein [Microlunatus speluncae]|uniref:GtrA family protein n=1 Tax=Microlunatus speluncae TaxID=2594267 RepID=UPI0012660985|nr:GtrA family protein [Microlunatus speluncae]